MVIYLQHMTFQDPGWYPDPLAEATRMRWWDGNEWGDATQPRLEKPAASNEATEKHEPTPAPTQAYSAASTGPTGQSPTQQWSPAGPPPPPAKKNHRTAYIVVGVLVVLALVGGIVNAARGDKDEPSSASDGDTTAVTTTTIDPSVAAAAAASSSAQAAADASASAAADAARQQEKEAKRDRSRYNEIDDRGWALIAKNPPGHLGEKVRIYGKVTQFDTATGSFTLRASTAGTQQENGYDYDINTVVTEGSTGEFADVVADDLVTLYVEVAGTESYKTTMGGETEAPRVVAWVVDVTGSDS